MMARDPTRAPSKAEWECCECGAINFDEYDTCDSCGFDRDGNAPKKEEEDE